MDRQRELKTQYEYICQCDACKAPGKYPTIDKLKKPSANFKKFVSGPDNKKSALQKVDVQFQKFCQYIDQQDVNYPTMEILALHEMIENCFELFAYDENY
jgi:hypothetical protein